MPLPEDGPYLAAAVFCEKVLEEKRGVFSLIGIVDQFSLTASGSDAPEEMPPSIFNLIAFIAFKAGAATGARDLELRLLSPNGEEKPLGVLPVIFEGGDRGDKGTNVTVNLTLQLKRQGLFWVKVFLNGESVTRMPFRVTYQRSSGTA